MKKRKKCSPCVSLSGQEAVTLATAIAVALSQGRELSEIQCLASLITNIGEQMINIANQISLQSGDDTSFL